MTTQTWPSVLGDSNQELVRFSRRISQIRLDDINDFTNLPNVFVSGRTVGRIPTSSANVLDTDKVGDVSYALDGSYMYIAVLALGSLSWRRVALGTW